MQICQLMFVTCQEAPFPLGSILLWFLMISKPLQTAKHKVSLENKGFFSQQFSPTKLDDVKRLFFFFLNGSGFQH